VSRISSRSPNVDRRSVLKALIAGTTGALGLSLATSSPSHVTSSPAVAQVPARLYGAIGDGVADDWAALQTAMSEAAEQGATLVIPPGTYRITKTLKAPRGLKLSAYGATITTYIPNLGNSGSIAASLMIDSVSNVTVSGLAIDGRKAAFSGVTEYKAGICINNARNVVIEDCDLFNCKGDGLIFYSRTPGQRNIGATVRNTVCRGNHRLGCAVTDLTDGRFEGCTFTTSSGTTPMGGLDIEPDRDSAWIDNITFHGCDFSGNGSVSRRDGAGATVSLRAKPTNPQGNVHFYGCSMRSNAIMGALIYYARDVSFHDCTIEKNGNAGLALIRTARVITVDGGSISRNALQGISALTSSGYTVKGLAVQNVKLHDNGTIWPRNYDGITLRSGCSNVVIRDCSITGEQRYGVWAASDVVPSLTIIDSDLSGNVKGPVYPDSIPIESSDPPEPTATRTPDASGRLSLSKSSSRYNGVVIATLTGFAPNTPVSLRWDQGAEIASLVTDQQGAGQAQFRTPLAVFGNHTVSAIGSSGGNASTTLRVTPRIKLTAASGPENTTLRVYLYGFAASERVEIQWSQAGKSSYSVLKTLTIASNGRATSLISVPRGSAPGIWSITGKVIGVRRSTREEFLVTAPESTPTPTSTAEPTATATSTTEPDPTMTSTPEPTGTMTPSPEPSETPTPTVEPSPTPEPSPSPTATAEASATPVEPTATAVE
jgi:hypothetical protein